MNGLSISGIQSGCAVVIPCYNHGSYLGEAIESVLAQSRLPDEIIVVDDGSTDDTKEVAGRFPQVRYEFQPNQGLSAARNRGLTLATSEFVIFLDADDRLRPDAVRIGADELERRPELAFVSGGYCRIDRQGKLLTEPTPADIPAGRSYEAFLRGNYVGMHAAVTYRRAAVADVGGFDTELSCCEDYDIYLRLSRLALVGTHQDVVADYRTYHGSMSGDLTKMFRTVMAVLHSQRPFVQGNTELRAALADGEDYWAGLYGAPLLKQSVRALARHDRAAGLAGLATAHLIYPKLVPKIVLRSIRYRLAKYSWSRSRPSAPDCGSGEISFGDLRRTEPFSRQFGFDRGLPVDRYYIEGFLDRHRFDIAGRVLEIGDSTYTRRFGEQRVSAAESLHIANPDATYQADLSDCPEIPDDTFDCAIVTQTIHLIYDVGKAVETLHRILKPGGVLLATVPGITQLSDDQWNEEWYWSFTDRSLRRALHERFEPGATIVESKGNVLTSAAFLYGLVAEDLSDDELEHNDQLYQMIVCGRAVKAPSAR